MVGVFPTPCCQSSLSEGYKGVNWQPSKGLNIYRQPRFREIFNRQMTNWQSSVKREIYSGGKKKLGPTSSDESTRHQMPKWIRLTLRRNLLTKPLFYWYWQKGLNFSDNWQSHNPLVTLLSGPGTGGRLVYSTGCCGRPMKSVMNGCPSLLWRWQCQR